MIEQYPIRPIDLLLMKRCEPKEQSILRIDIVFKRIIKDLKINKLFDEYYEGFVDAMQMCLDYVLFQKINKNVETQSLFTVSNEYVSNEYVRGIIEGIIFGINLIKRKKTGCHFIDNCKIENTKSKKRSETCNCFIWGIFRSRQQGRA